MAEGFGANSAERRRREDGWLVIIRCLAGLGWLALVGALFFLDQAKPEYATFFDRWYHIPLRSTWRPDLACYILYCMLFGLGVSLVGLVINLRRMRRREDQVRFSLVFIALVSLAGIIKYLISF